MAANGFDQNRWSTKRRSKRVLRGAGTAHVGGALIAGQPHRPRVGGSLPDRYLLGQGPHRARITPDNKGRVAEFETAAAFHFGLGYVRSNGSQVSRPTGGTMVPGSGQATSHRRGVGGEIHAEIESPRPSTGRNADTSPHIFVATPTRITVRMIAGGQLPNVAAVGTS